MNTPKRLMLTLLVMVLAVTVLSAPVLAADPTTEVHLVKYANDEETVLNETTVDYHWMMDNLPVQGDGVTRYYMEGPVFEGEWEKAHPDEPYDGWDTDEDVQMAFLYKGDLGPVKGTKITDLCSLVGGASPGDTIKVYAVDGWARAYPYSQIYEPDPRQGPAVLCWYCGNDSGPNASPDQRQGQGYPDTGYRFGMRMIFFGDTSSNPWGWHAFGNNDMRECWDESYWNKGGQYWSVVGTSPKWVSEIRIYSQEAPEPPIANFTVNMTSGAAPLTVAFTDTSTGNPTSWSWDFGDGATSTDRNPVHTYTSAGTFTISLTATNAVDSDTLELSDSIIVAEHGTTVPIADFTADRTSGYVPLTVTFNDVSSGPPTAWLWDFGDGATSNEQNPVHTYTAVGTYNVILTATNAVGTNSTEKNGYITTKSYSGGDGGDSGDSGSVTTANTTAPLANITETSTTVAIQSRTFSFNGSGIDEITVSGLFDPASLNISCEKVAAPTGTTPEAPGKVYAYYTITCGNENATLDEGRIRFSVPEAWIEENNLENSSFVLYQYNLGWDSLVTKRVGTENGSRIYEATTPGFSLLAISSERTTYTHIVTIPPMKENISSKQTTQAPAEEEEPTGNSPAVLWIGIAAVALVAAAGITYWYLRLRNKTDKTEEN